VVQGLTSLAYYAVPGSARRDIVSGLVLTSAALLLTTSEANGRKSFTSPRCPRPSNDIS
jgi:hypothetical protein